MIFAFASCETATSQVSSSSENKGYQLIHPSAEASSVLSPSPADTPAKKPSPKPKKTQEKAKADEKPGEPLIGEKAYVGSAKSDKYHLPKCKWASKISPENRVWFSSKEDAKSKGYVPCKVCKP